MGNLLLVTLKEEGMLVEDVVREWHAEDEMDWSAKASERSIESQPRALPAQKGMRVPSECYGI